MVHRFWNDRPVTHLCELASLIYVCVLFSTSFPQMPNRFLPVLNRSQLLPGEHFPGTPLETPKSIKEAAISHYLTDY